MGLNVSENGVSLRMNEITMLFHKRIVLIEKENNGFYIWIYRGMKRRDILLRFTEFRSNVIC